MAQGANFWFFLTAMPQKKEPGTALAGQWEMVEEIRLSARDHAAVTRYNDSSLVQSSTIVAITNTVPTQSEGDHRRSCGNPGCSHRQ